MTIEIRRMSTQEANVSQRHVTYDVYRDDEYLMSFDDVLEAQDFRDALLDN